jgi:hypothetical protein
MSANNSSDWRNQTVPYPASLPLSVLLCTIVSSSLSIIGAVVIFVTYCIVTVAKNQTRRLLVYLTIADFLIAGGNLVGALRYALRDESSYMNNVYNRSMDCARWDDQICVIQSCVTTFASLASFFWTNIIMIHILMTLISQREWSNLRKKVIYHLVAWGLPCK